MSARSPKNDPHVAPVVPCPRPPVAPSRQVNEGVVELGYGTGSVVQGTLVLTASHPVWVPDKGWCAVDPSHPSPDLHGMGPLQVRRRPKPLGFGFASSSTRDWM